MKAYIRHLPHYLGLIALLITGLTVFILFNYDKAVQVIVAILVAAAYVAWGIFHHRIHKDFDIAVVIEYLAVAILGLVIVFSLIFRI